MERSPESWIRRKERATPWFSKLFRPSRADAEVDEEIRFHLDRETELRIDRGVPPTRAREAARRDFGNVLIVKETTRQTWGWTVIEDLGRDLRYSTHLLLRAPAFTIVAVLSLALGIGANTAIFSLADAVIFRDLPVFEPSQLFQVRGVAPRQVHSIYSYPLYQEIRDRNRVFSSTVCAGSWASVEPVMLERDSESSRELRARV